MYLIFYVVLARLIGKKHRCHDTEGMGKGDVRFDSKRRDR